MTRALIALGAAAALLGTVWQAGALHERTRWQMLVAELAAERRAISARAQGLADALASESAERAEFARQLEEAADADDDAGRVALPARSLQRIGAR